MNQVLRHTGLSQRVPVLPTLWTCNAVASLDCALLPDVAETGQEHATFLGMRSRLRMYDRSPAALNS